MFSPVQSSSPVPGDTGYTFSEEDEDMCGIVLSIADNYLFCLLVHKSKMNCTAQEKIDATTKDDKMGNCKFIVFELQLMALLKKYCSCDVEMVELKTSTSGTLPEVSDICMS